MTRLTASLPFVCLVLLCLPPLQASSLEDAAAFTLSPGDLLDEANRATTNVTAPAIVLLNEAHWSFQPDGTISLQQHYIFKLMNAAAVQGWSEAGQRWEPWHEQLPSIRARVVTHDSIAHELDPKTLVDAPAGGNTNQIYSDARILQGPLPAVEAGAVVEEEISTRMTPLLGSMSRQIPLAAGVPIRMHRVIIDYPESMPVRYSTVLSPNLKEEKSVQDGIVHLTLTFGSFDAIEYVEPFLPFDVPRIPGLFLSSGASWNEVAANYDDILEKQLGGAQLKEFVTTVVGKETDRPVVIAKLLRAVHREVRYTGVEFAQAAIVPAKPEVVLARKYGDCKDKASLLVAMLRCAGIPASVALLNAGFEQDVSPKHPGMGVFNHAIVYVPGPPALWIDATAEHMEPGSVPSMDQGRLALIVSHETTELVHIPEAPAGANVSTTTRELYLPNFGPARVVQKISGTGEVGAQYRDLVILLGNESARKELEKRVQSEWDTKQAITINRPDASGSGQPFEFSVDINGSKSLAVSETGTTVNLPIFSVFESLPAYFAEDDSKNPEKQNRAPRAHGFVLPNAVIGKLSYMIVMPEGFELKKLPDDETVRLGPATFKARYVRQVQTITADFSFDPGRRSYTSGEGAALKEGLIEFIKRQTPVLEIQPIGQVLLDAGRLRDGLDAFRGLVARHSNEAINHVRLSRAYLSVNCGEQARQEAGIAAKMASELPLVWRNLAFVNEHDLIGRNFGKGWDPAAVEAPLRKAMTLDPDDLSIPAELAQTFEYDEVSRHYTSRPRLQKAIEVYAKMGDQNIETQNVSDALLYDLAYAGKFDQLEQRLNKPASEEAKRNMRLVIGLIKDGPAKALAALQNGPGSPEQRAQAAGIAFNVMLPACRYPEAAEALAAWYRGQASSSRSSTQVETLRNMKHFDIDAIKPDSPEHAVQLYLVYSVAGPGVQREMPFLLSSQAPKTMYAATRTYRPTATMLTGLEMSDSSVVDWVLSSTTYTTDANADSGFRVRLSRLGSNGSIYTVSEDGVFKVLGDTAHPQGVAGRVHAELQAGREDVARCWLDWLRQDIKLRSEDDPLAGAPFAHLWRKGEAADGKKMRFVAAAISADVDDIPTLKEAMASSSDSGVWPFYALACLRACSVAKRWNDGIPVAEQLLQSFSDSQTVRITAGSLLAKAGKGAEAESVLQTEIKKSPDDLAAKRALLSVLLEEGKLSEALQIAKEAAQSTGATSADWNNYGWYAFAAGQSNLELIHNIERAESEPQLAIQHTIACMYAELGKLDQARQVSLNALRQYGATEVPDQWWLVFGLIAEQLDVVPAARSYYGHVTQPPGEILAPLSARELALKRLANLGNGS